MGTSSVEALFCLPDRDLASLSFCKPTKISLTEWIATLPLADSIKSVRMLYLATKEICEFKTNPANRMELIDTLRPIIHSICQGLKKAYLNQPIILPEQPQQIANLCYGLQSFLAKAYLICACQCTEKMDSIIFKKPTQLLAQAIYHHFLENTSLLIRNYLLYRPTPDMFWKNSHRLFQIALQFNLQNISIIDDERGNNSTSNIQHVYMQLLMWGFIQANQLRQDEIERLEDHMWDLSRLVNLAAVIRDQKSLIIFDPSLDEPPMHQKYYRGDYPQGCQSLNPQLLVDKLNKLSTHSAQRQTDISPNLVDFLTSSWASFSERIFMRLDNHAQISFCIGIPTTHYYIGNKKLFSEFFTRADDSLQPAQQDAKNSIPIAETKLTPILPQEPMGLMSNNVAITGTGAAKPPATNNSEENSVDPFTRDSADKYQTHRVEIVNMSPGGYCLQWIKNVPQTLKPGEIIGLRENDRGHWNLGSIRWLRHSKEKTVQIGVELLSPSAMSYGARIADSAEKPLSDFMRVLVLPEIKLVHKPSTIITPTSAFKPGQRVLLTRDGGQQHIELNDIVSSTPSYLQFAYTVITPFAAMPVFKSNTHIGTDQQKPVKDSDSIHEQKKSENKSGDTELFSNWDNL